MQTLTCTSTAVQKAHIQKWLIEYTVITLIKVTGILETQ